MARSKEFDREKALARAIDVFAQRGFEGASTEVLLKAMRISRQSLYDTFGTKRDLYLEALRRYNDRSTARVLESLESGTSPLGGIEHALLSFLDDASRHSHPPCLGVGAICEFGGRDARVVEATEASGRLLFDRLVRAFQEAKAAGEVGEEFDAATGAGFFISNLTGLKVMARGGATLDELQPIARLAIKMLASR